MNRLIGSTIMLALVVACADGNQGAESPAEASVVPALPSGNWRLTAIAADGVEAKPIGNVTLSIDASSSQLSGSAGCNRYTATYSLTGTQMTVGPAAATKRYCGAPEGLMDQEAAYLALLSNAHELQTGKQGVLTLKCAAGTLEFSGELEERDAQQKGD